MRVTRTLEEKFGELLAVKRRARDDEAEGRAARDERAEDAKEYVCVECALVGFVEHNHTVLLEVRVRHDLSAKEIALPWL